MKSDRIALARSYIQIESNAIQEVSAQLGENFNQAVDLIAKCTGKVVFCGIGKSGHIGNKLSATFSSIGIPSLFLHASESMHGDLGVLASNDILLFISYSGETSELTVPLKFAARKKIPIISMTGKLDSTLAKHSQVVLSISISKEACPYNLAPTASTTAALVMGDALGLVAAHEKGYSPEKFAENHPSGMLGLRLTQIQDLMWKEKDIAVMHEADTVKTLLSKMTHAKVRGVAAVVDANSILQGVVTDGDIRRFFERPDAALTQTVSSVMSKNPKTLSPLELVENAISIMEEFKIQSLLVTDSNRKLLGLIHVQNILKEI
jgi:arabinose-5-phosphate isomerase